jgi:microcystin-dependent protein
MSLESATYVKQLVAANPDGADPKGQGDDHLRLIKSTLLNTFPNLDAAVTATPADLNAVAGGLRIFQSKMIILWNGTIATIPTGWVLCNGTAGTPDLRDRFVVGAGGAYAVNSTGGVQSHNHAITVFGTALTVAQLPPHSHDAPAGTTGFITSGSGAGNTVAGANIGTSPSTNLTGSGATHNHTASSATSDNRPPYWALAYIMKT